MSYAIDHDECHKDLSADEDDSAPPLLETYWSAHNTTVNVVQELEPQADVPLSIQDTYWATHPRNASDIPLPEEVWLQTLQEPDSDMLTCDSVQQESNPDASLNGYGSTKDFDRSKGEGSEPLLSNVYIPQYTLLGNGRVDIDVKPYFTSDTVRV